MDTNGLVFIGFIFFEAIKQILYCFLTLHSCNFKTMSFWKHKNKLDLLSPTYYLFLQGRFDFVQSSYIDLVKWVSTIIQSPIQFELHKITKYSPEFVLLEGQALIQFPDSTFLFLLFHIPYSTAIQNQQWNSCVV